MSRNHQAVVDQALRLAAEMPRAMAESLADAIERGVGSSWVSARTAILQGISQPHYRALASEFLDAWQTTAPDLSPQAVSLALHAAAASEQANRQRQSVELVWTGPATQGMPLRQTEQACPRQRPAHRPGRLPPYPRLLERPGGCPWCRAEAQELAGQRPVHRPARRRPG
jgi:hypothetical protein